MPKKVFLRMSKGTVDKKVFVLATTLALILGIAGSSFAETNTKVKTPNGKVMM